jgi:hypothetical protein
MLVADELRANIVRYEIALRLEPGEAIDRVAYDEAEVPDGLASQTYQDLQHSLIGHQRLDPETRDAVRAAYVFARVPRSLEHRLDPTLSEGWGGGEPTPSAWGIVDQIKEALTRTRLAYSLLRSYVPPSAEI